MTTMPRILVLEANVENVTGVVWVSTAVRVASTGVEPNGSGHGVAVDCCRAGRGRRDTASLRDAVDATVYVAAEGEDNIHCDSVRGAGVEGHRHRAAEHTDGRGDGVGAVAVAVIGGEAVEAAVRRHRDCFPRCHWFQWFDLPDETVLVVAAVVVRRGVSTFDPIVPDVVEESFWNVGILVDIPGRFPGGDRVDPCGDPWPVIECADVWHNILRHSRPWPWPW